MIAALSKYQFGQDTEETAMCAKCVKATGPKGSVVVRGHDLWDSGHSGDIDLTLRALKNIPNLRRVE
ncbi:hypothetical protein K7432_015955 [Basidiobolus ranarum]|uniref:Uncharacterized protein n=1 Tax=Basidiobolus ranarum TaxID=34480 RepID=A0ABR2WFK9_9FUNG